MTTDSLRGPAGNANEDRGLCSEPEQGPSYKSLRTEENRPIIVPVYRLMDLLVVLLILACAGMNGCTGSSPQAAIGDRLPACEIENLKGGNAKIPDDLDGKVVIIRFWSDCCSYNIHEMEGLDSLYTKYREKGLSVLTIYSGNTREKARQFADELKVPYLVLLDPQMVIAKQYAVTRMPTTFVVDRKGIIREKIIGISEKEAWAQSYEPLIASLL